MENLNAEQVKRGLEQFHHRILNTNLAEKVTQSEMMAIINALALINSQEHRIKELDEENERLQDLVKEVQEYNEAWVKDNHDLRAENERLRADTLLEYGKRVYQLIWGFIGEKLSEQDKDYITVRLGQIAKEMLEGE